MPSARAPMPAPQMIETPAMRRSALLAKMLEQQRQPTEIKGGYGELGARLLAQGITKWSGERAEKAALKERNARTAGQADAYGLQLARLLGNEPPPSSDASSPAPMTVPMPSEPVSTGPTAPVGEVMGSRLPAVGQPIPVADVPPATPVSPAETTPMPTLESALLSGPTPSRPNPVAPVPQMAAPAAPTAPQNPLRGTPGELASIQEGLDVFRRTGDPAVGAWVNGEISRIRQRMDAPAAERQEVVDINGIKYLVDPTGANPPTPLFGEQGVPELARTRTVVAGPNDPYGMVEGTTYSINPSGVASVVRTPSPGYRGSGGREAFIEGGPSDPRAGERRIENEGKLRREFVTLTEEYRNVRQAFQKVEASLGLATGIGDIGGIFGIMKVFDPGSTVREGEAASVQNSAGVPEYIRSLYNRAVNGELLTPQQRADILAVGRAQFGTYEQGYQSRVTDFTRMANDYGIDPRNIVGGGESDAPAPSGGGSPPRITTQAQYDALASGEPYLDPNGVRRTKQ